MNQWCFKVYCGGPVKLAELTFSFYFLMLFRKINMRQQEFRNYYLNLLCFSAEYLESFRRVLNINFKFKWRS